MLVQVLQVLVPAAGVDDEVDRVLAGARDDGVVDDPSPLVREHRQRARTDGDPPHVADDQGLEERDGVLALERQAAHVGHVEERGLRPAVLSGVHDGVAVLDRHRPPGEGDHLAWCRGRGRGGGAFEGGERGREGEVEVEVESETKATDDVR